MIYYMSRLLTFTFYSEDYTPESADDLPKRRKRPVKDFGGSDEEWDFVLPLKGNYFQ